LHKVGTILNGQLDENQEKDKEDGKQELAQLSMLETKKQWGVTVRISCSTTANYDPNPIYRMDHLSYRANDVTFAIEQVAAHQSAPRTRPYHDAGRISA
jgi:hypothetical protein